MTVSATFDRRPPNVRSEDVSRPHLRWPHGDARISTDIDDVDAFHGAFAVIVLTVRRIFPNCGRYIHGDEVSEHVPREDHEPPTPGWESLDAISDALPAGDPARRADV